MCHESEHQAPLQIKHLLFACRNPSGNVVGTLVDGDALQHHPVKDLPAVVLERKRKLTYFRYPTET